MASLIYHRMALPTVSLHQTMTNKSYQMITAHILNEINIVVMKSRTFAICKPLLEEDFVF